MQPAVLQNAGGLVWQVEQFWQHQGKLIPLTVPKQAHCETDSELPVP